MSAEKTTNLPTERRLKADLRRFAFAFLRAIPFLGDMKFLKPDRDEQILDQADIDAINSMDSSSLWRRPASR